MSKPLSALGRIRTLNPQSRNLIFYPVELRVHDVLRIAPQYTYKLCFEYSLYFVSSFFQRDR